MNRFRIHAAEDSAERHAESWGTDSGYRFEFVAGGQDSDWLVGALSAARSGEYQRAILKPSVAGNEDVFLTMNGPGAAKSIYVSLLRNGSYHRATRLPFSDGAKLDVDPEVAPRRDVPDFQLGSTGLGRFA